MHYILSHCLINTYNGYTRQTITINKIRRNILTQNKISILVSHESNDNVTMFATRMPGQMWLLDIQTDVGISLRRVLRNFAQSKQKIFRFIVTLIVPSRCLSSMNITTLLLFLFLWMRTSACVDFLFLHKLQCYQANNYSSVQ